MFRIIFYLSMVMGIVALGDGGAFGQTIQQSDIIQSIMNLLREMMAAIKNVVASFGNISGDMPKGLMPDSSGTAAKIIETTKSLQQPIK